MTCGLAHEERQAELVREHGKPRRVNHGAALRLLGLRDEVHPHDVMAFAYRDHDAAVAWAASNLEHYGHPSLGIAIGGDEIIGVLDLRPMLFDAGVGLTSPTRPDDWQPPVINGKAS